MRAGDRRNTRGATILFSTVGLASSATSRTHWKAGGARVRGSLERHTASVDLGEPKIRKSNSAGRPRVLKASEG